MTTLPFAEPSGGAPPAPHSRRIPAAILDAVFNTIGVGICGTAGFVVGLAIGGARQRSTTGGRSWDGSCFGSLLGLALGVLIWLAVTVWLVRRPGPHNGQTIGKQLLGIRAMRGDGREIGAGWAFMREILAKAPARRDHVVGDLGLLGFIDGGAIGGARGDRGLVRPGLLRRRAPGAARPPLRHPRRPRRTPGRRRPHRPAADEDLWPAAT